ncbi:MAG: hypothetical protein NWE94_04840 [Candidatus Bathyarchaeota archaeon]|nr:hypothetical protein [Candidatus Bathyarchaeota archaeon]
MKKIALAVTLIVGLIFWVTFSCAVVGAQDQQASDSLQDYYDRYKPKMTPPTISIASPQNYSVINTNSISLVFNVSEPQVIEISPDANKVSTRLFRVSYKGDWQTEEHFLYSAEHGSLDFLEFNTTLLNIPDGTHQLQVIADGVVGFTVAMFGFSYNSETNTSIIFTVNSTQPTPSTFTSTPEPFPTLPLIASSSAIAVVAVAWLFVSKEFTGSRTKKKSSVSTNTHLVSVSSGINSDYSSSSRSLLSFRACYRST